MFNSAMTTKLGSLIFNANILTFPIKKPSTIFEPEQIDVENWKRLIFAFHNKPLFCNHALWIFHETAFNELSLKLPNQLSKCDSFDYKTLSIYKQVILSVF